MKSRNWKYSIKGNNLEIQITENMNDLIIKSLSLLLRQPNKNNA